MPAKHAGQSNDKEEVKNMGFAEDVAELETAWDEAPQEREGGDFGPLIPDGQTQAMVLEADVRQRESDEHWQFYLKFQNRSGTVRKWSDLDHEVGLRVARQDAAMLGYAGALPGLEAAAKEMVGLVCDIAVKTKAGNERDFTNVYLNRCQGQAADRATFDVDPEILANHQAAEGAPAGATAAAGIDASDDIPF